MRRLVLATVLAALASTASAQETERYRLERTDSGYVRMDTTTGEMSLCEERAGQLVCKLAADERAAFQDEVDRMRGDIKALDERIAKLEKPGLPLMSDEDFERSMGYMEKFFRSFMGIVKELGEEKAAPTPAPQKT